jgi:hypothetical protein
MNKYKGTILIGIGWALWIIETAYFGWNNTPQSGAEKILDTMSWFFILYGLFLELAFAFKSQTTIKADNVYIDGKIINKKL